jgi:malate synthase
MPDAAAITNELELNAQSSLGYVARWVQFGVGCSKV